MRNFILATWTLMWREVVRFFRQPSRIMGVIGSPALFWLLIGSGLGSSFRLPSAPPQMDYLEYFFPGTLVLIVLFTAIFSTISIIEDRREGFLQSVLVAPISRSSLVLGKILGVTLLALIQGVLFLLLAPAINITLTFSTAFLTVGVLFLISFGLSALGFFIAWRMESTQGFHAIMNLVLLPMWMLSGALFPVSGAATWLAKVMALNPVAYGVSAVRLSLYELNLNYATGLPSLTLSLMVTGGFCLLTFSAAVWAAHRPLSKSS